MVAEDRTTGRPGVACEADELGRRQVRGQVVDVPVVFAEAGRRHHGRQGVPFVGRSGGHGDAPRPALRLVHAGGDQPLADRSRAVLLGDRQLAGRPGRADAAQGRGDDLVTQPGQGRAGGHPGEILPRQCLIAGCQGRVEPVGLGGPVPDPDLLRRLRPGLPPGHQVAHVAFAHLVTARGLARGQHALPDPAVGGLVVHAECVGSIT